MSILQDAERLVSYVNALKAEGGKMATQNPDAIPPAAGIFLADADEWQPGIQYQKGDVFTYGGMTGYVKQPYLTSQDIYPPFSVGTEALYGARPAPDADGVYPYVYNMGIYTGMLVRDEGVVYRSITGTWERPTELLYRPADVPALLTPVGHDTPGGGGTDTPPADEWPDWVQPTGAHDAYAAGAKVTYDGKHWVSDVNANVWMPGVYGWTQAT